MSNSERAEPGRAAILDAVPILALVPPDVRAIIEAGFVSQRFPFGTVIVGQGEPAEALYVVSSGRARVLITAAGGEEVPLNSLGPGDCFGEAGLLAPGGVRTSTVRASEELEVLRLDGAVLRAIVRAHPGVGEHLELLRRRHAARDLLRRTPFGRLPADAMAEFLEALRPLSIGAGEAVVAQGDPPGSVYSVVEGRLRAYREDRDVGDLAYYGPGDFFGEHSLLTGEPRAATVRAVSDCRLLELAPAAYQRLLADPDLRRDMDALAAQYDYERIASVPLGFADELLPADVVDRSRDGEGRGADAAVAPDEPVEEMEAVAGPARHRRRSRTFPLVRQVDEADCGAACLAMVCRHFGSAPSLARVRQAARTGIGERSD